MQIKDIEIDEITYHYDTVEIYGAEKEYKILESIIVKFKYNKNLHGGLVIKTDKEDMTIKEIKERIMFELNGIEYDSRYDIDEIGQQLYERIHKAMNS